MNPMELSVPVSAQRGIVTIGNFDGVHRGHQQMLSTLRDIADDHGAPAVVVTFDPHPLSLLKPDAPLPRLSTISRRVKLLYQYGADAVVVLPVTHALLKMTPEEFFRDVMCGELKATGVIEGPNFRFGRNRTGDVELLSQFCRQADVRFQVTAPVETDGRMISSSRIRERLAAGCVSEAVAMLGHAHRLPGAVARGAGRGRELGFPTANLEGVQVMQPGDGVYAGVTEIDGTRYPVAVSIGPNPTFADDRRKIECHIAGFERDLYGQMLFVDLIGDIRPLRSFASADELVRQIEADVAKCRDVVKHHG